jgi:hypothetical protein
MSSLYNWTLRFNFWHVLWLWISAFYSSFSVYSFMWYLISGTYIFIFLKSCLYNVYLFTLLIIRTIHCYNLEILVLFETPPPENETVPKMSLKICETDALYGMWSRYIVMRFNHVTKFTEWEAACSFSLFCRRIQPPIHRKYFIQTEDVRW